ncbi:thioester domain-containing protein [Auritidibacter ignavus]|uniref:thioester domain-containing protein n=1 Tax=Auritidibacter ignavus TaxID=678932 RepID=UPI00244A7FD2|nr:thioester domain-containing protein [Auritidibacter ignavus]WGH82943.1 Cys-Gln thioester bond-forming surface protein [Auritidibacter ignavus]
MNARSTPLTPTTLLTTGATLSLAVILSATPDPASATLTDGATPEARLINAPAESDAPAQDDAPAHYSTPDFDVGDSTTLTGKGEPGFRVHTTDADGQNPLAVATRLFEVEINGDTVLAYCLEIMQTSLLNSTGTVDTWEDFAETSPGPETTRDAATSLRVGWIVQNSYPAVGLEQLAEAVPGVSELTSQEAISATQAAIWHYTDGIWLGEETVSASNRSGEPTEGSADTVQAVYTYLTEQAQDLDLEAEENTEVAPGRLQVDDTEFLIPADRASGEETLLGPVSIDAASGQISVSAESDSGTEYTYTDDEGEPLDLGEVGHGDEIYLAHTEESPEEDTVTLSLEQSHISQHRFVTLPVHPESQRRSQAIMLVTAREHDHEDQVELSFSTETEPVEAPSTPAHKEKPEPTSEDTPEEKLEDKQESAPAPTPEQTPEEAPVEPPASTPDVAKPVNAGPTNEETDKIDQKTDQGAEEVEKAADEPDEELAKTGSSSSLIVAGLGGVIVLILGILLVRYRNREDG